jgi:hypothetical protein
MLKKRQLSRSRELTLPDERYRAVRHTELFLQRLAGGHYARVPKAVREEARALLRHYPSDYDLDRAADTAPHVFVKRLDPLYKMVKQHDMQQRMAEDVEQDLLEALEKQQQQL